MKNKTKQTLASLLVASSLLGGCADYTTPQAQNNPDVSADEHESLNRGFYAVNKALDTVIIRPVTDVYRFIVPGAGRRMVSNFVENLGQPVTFVNSALQGDQKNTFATLWRFLINTTVGIGGVFDVAEEAGLENRPADFGQTLYVWGVPSGPYTFLPVFGPGTVRDSFGRIVDIAFNPLVWANENWYALAQAGITIVDRRSSNYELIEQTYDRSLDPYATFRSGYLQRRTAELAKAKRFEGGNTVYSIDDDEAPTKANAAKVKAKAKAKAPTPKTDAPKTDAQVPASTDVSVPAAQ